ncbi:MAG: SGNH/GDSL hydrolase family protein [Desulfobacteraceae bacterium]|nr:SGNH/GDSL hydrolase family protein [Desulfobacteraceae bacterium]
MKKNNKSFSFPVSSSYVGKFIIGVLIAFLGIEFLISLLFQIRHFNPAYSNFKSPEEILFQAKSKVGIKKPYVLILGNSVMTNDALKTNGVLKPQDKGISSLLEKKISNKIPGVSVLNLSMNGMLANDFQGLTNLLLQHAQKPSLVIFQIDYRLFSSVHGTEGYLSRKWLIPFVSDKEGNPSAFESQVSKRNIDLFTYKKILLNSNAYILLRGGWGNISQMITQQLPLREKFDVGKMDSVLDKEMSLKLMVAHYYSHSEEYSYSTAYKILEMIIKKYVDNQIPVLLVFSPVNFNFLQESINLKTYAYNVNNIEKTITSRFGRGSNVQYFSLENIFSNDLFIDHCHLTEEGNKKAADLIASEFFNWLRSIPTKESNNAI